jgi:hypothetical protein
VENFLGFPQFFTEYRKKKWFLGLSYQHFPQLACGKLGFYPLKIHRCGPRNFPIFAKKQAKNTPLGVLFANCAPLDCKIRNNLRITKKTRTLFAAKTTAFCHWAICLCAF